MNQTKVAAALKTIIPDADEAIRSARRISSTVAPLGNIRTAEDAYIALAHFIWEEQR